MSAYLQDKIVATNLPGFPWPPGNKVDLYAIPLNNAFIALQNQITNAENQIALLQVTGNGPTTGTSVTLNWGGDTLVTAGTYVVTATCPYPFTIASIDTYVGTNGGSFQVTVNNNFEPIAGLTNVPVGTPAQKLDQVATGGNQVLLSSEIDVVISNVVGQPMNAYVCINSIAPILTQPPPTPVFAFMAGFAPANSNALGVLAATVQFSASASGSSSAIGISAALLPGQVVGTISGTSKALGVMTSTSSLPVLSLDDPSEGGLDFNPLG